MRPLRPLLLCLGFSVLLLVSSNAKAQGKACEAGSRPGGWTEAENYVWNHICAGGIANFDEGRELDPGSSCYCVPTRRISWKFLNKILSDERFREAVTHRGVRIIGACFPDKIDLKNGRLPWPLELRHSRFEKGLNMLRLRADRHVSLKDSVVSGKLNMGSASIKGSLYMQNTFSEGINLREANIGGQLAMTGAEINGPIDMMSVSIGSHLSHLQNSNSTSRVELTDFDSWSFWL